MLILTPVEGVAFRVTDLLSSWRDHSGPLAFWRGRFLPAEQALVPRYDGGFVQGAMLTEQLRTYRQQLFRLPQHLERLAASAQLAELETTLDPAELSAIAVRLTAHNAQFLANTDELGLAMLLTPGSYPAFSDGDDYGPEVWMHTYRLPQERWQSLYRQGVRLRSSEVRQVPPSSWPTNIKCRSRLHYARADRLMSRRDPGARALLLDQEGYVNETSTANVVVCLNPADGPRLVSPPRERILPGISLDYVWDLAAELGWRCEERLLRPEELHQADEIWLTSTPFGLLPVVRFDDNPISGGQPGGRYQTLLRAWIAKVGVDFTAG